MRRVQRRKRTDGGPIAAAIAVLAFLAFPCADAQALGTPANTTITSSATVNGVIDGAPFTVNAVASFTVDERVDLALTWQDAAPVTVSPGQTGAVATFRLTNTGNGNDRCTISASGAGISGDQFDPAVTALYLDANGDNVFQPGADTLYTGSTGTIAADGFRTIFVLSTIPASSLNAGDLGLVGLLATSMTGTGPAGTVLPAAGDGGTDAVIGASLGIQAASGSYAVSGLATVQVAKAAVVTDPYGGNRPQPGATIRYTLTVTVSGAGSANSVVISDVVPPNTTYTRGTLALDGGPLSDDADADAGDVGFTAPDTVTVSFGNLISASPARIITFDVTID